MAQMVKSYSYEMSKDILLKPSIAVEIAVEVNSTGVVAGEDGRKVIKAGTPVGATTSVLDERKTVLSVANTSANGANAQGVLRYDVDVTDGTVSTTLIVQGAVDSSKCPTIVAEAKKALTHIIFINGGAY